MMKRGLKKKVITVLCTCLLLIQTGCGREFDASEYTKAVLDLSFQRDMTKALALMPEVPKESLDQQYDQFIQSFVENNITNGLDVDELKAAQFSDIVAKIFSSIRYTVGEAEKIGKSEYKVPVKVQTTNVFLRFQERLTEDSLKIAEKVKSGGYQGTEEQVASQVMQDMINHAYELLEVSYMDASYGENVTVNVTVKADSNKEYSISDKDMGKLLTKILQLDEIQG